MKKILFLFVVFSIFACSKDDEETPDVSIIEHGWVNGHESQVPEEYDYEEYPDGYVGWKWDMYVVLKNNTNDTIKGVFAFKNEYINAGLIPWERNEFLIIPPRETKEFHEVSFALKDFYDSGYEDVEFYSKAWVEENFHFPNP